MRRALWIIVALGVAACGGSQSPTAPGPSSPARVRDVLVLGDSLAVYPAADQSFPAVLQTRINQGSLPWKIVNAGVSGDTTEDGVHRFEPLLTGDVAILILELGANDGLRGVDIGTVETNLSTIIESARRHDVRVLLCGMETPPTHGLDYSVAFHLLFPRVAQRYQTPLVPFLLAGALTPELTGPDGVHPNAAGAQRIADNVWPFLEPMLH
jgi:acyl-CoA thioesterase-1